MHLHALPSALRYGTEPRNFRSTCRISWNHYFVIVFDHRLIISAGADMGEGDIFYFALGIASGAVLLWMMVIRLSL